MQILANPNRFFQIADRLMPVLWIATAVAFSVAFYFAFFNSPPDYQQGETVRIMYVHVPSASLALFVYVFMAFASAMALIFRHPLADAAAKAAAPLGAAFCFLALVTGSIWGKPMWGTWWVWDARLTSMFVLMLLYLGYMAIWRAFDDPPPRCRTRAHCGACRGHQYSDCQILRELVEHLAPAGEHCADGWTPPSTKASCGPLD